MARRSRRRTAGSTEAVPSSSGTVTVRRRRSSSEGLWEVVVGGTAWSSGLVSSLQRISTALGHGQRRRGKTMRRRGAWMRGHQTAEELEQRAVGGGGSGSLGLAGGVVAELEEDDKKVKLRRGLRLELVGGWVLNGGGRAASELGRLVARAEGQMRATAEDSVGWARRGRRYCWDGRRRRGSNCREAGGGGAGGAGRHSRRGRRRRWAGRDSDGRRADLMRRRRGWCCGRRWKHGHELE